MHSFGRSCTRVDQSVASQIHNSFQNFPILCPDPAGFNALMGRSPNYNVTSFPSRVNRPMQTYAHVIAEFQYGSWSAWFSDSPHLVCENCLNWEHAVATLIDVHGSSDLVWHQIFAIETTARDGHAEFLIPYATWSALPATTSAN